MKKIYNYCFGSFGESLPSANLNYDIPYSENADMATMIALLLDIKLYLKVLAGKK